MSNQSVFQRYELKYLINSKQKSAVVDAMRSHMKEDEYGRSTICNIYFDASNYLLIRHSLDKPVYKEKLRVRSYGVARSDSPVFVELKKKYKSVVYKRRISMTEQEAMEYLCQKKHTGIQSQIGREIDYFFHFYGPLQPTVFLSYDREAYYQVSDENFRITFDENILWRDYDLSLEQGAYGTPLLDSGCTLMEIKTSGAIPLWLVSVLTNHHIYKTSFSKYGTAFQQILCGSLIQNGGFYDRKNIFGYIRQPDYSGH